jgi:hypothetical protein
MIIHKQEEPRQEEEPRRPTRLLEDGVRGQRSRPRDKEVSEGRREPRNIQTREWHRTLFMQLLLEGACSLRQPKESVPKRPELLLLTRTCCRSPCLVVFQSSSSWAASQGGLEASLVNPKHPEPDKDHPGLLTNGDHLMFM